LSFLLSGPGRFEPNFGCPVTGMSLQVFVCFVLYNGLGLFGLDLSFLSFVFHLLCLSFALPFVFAVCLQEMVNTGISIYRMSFEGNEVILYPLS
jgi:hypothetical protein